MSKRLALMLCVIATACGDNGVAPSPGAASNGFAGQWSGTVLVLSLPPSGAPQSQPISFTVSADQRVTDISIGYRFNGCSGVKTFSGLSLAIAASSANSPGPSWGYGSPTPDGNDHTQVFGFFTSARTAMGTAGFVEFPGCGSGGGNFSATKQ